MKLLIKPNSYTEEFTNCDGLILPLKNYSVDYETYFTLNEIKTIRNTFKKEIFVVINKMIFNNEIEKISIILKELDSLNISGIFFYDLAILQLKKDLNLKIDLVWNATHMTTNYKTCDYYHEQGVKYAYLSNEITLKETLEIKEKSKIIPMFTLIAYPPVAMSRRHLITNYNKMHNLENNDYLEIEEKVTKEKYKVFENINGTTFKYSKVLNNTEALEQLVKVDFPYLILIEDGIEHKVFINILNIINNYLTTNSSLKEISDLIGNNTGFLNKETIYKVKKNG